MEKHQHLLGLEMLIAVEKRTKCRDLTEDMKKAGNVPYLNIQRQHLKLKGSEPVFVSIIHIIDQHDDKLLRHSTTIAVINGDLYFNLIPASIHDAFRN